jgi:hypothetical protein
MTIESSMPQDAGQQQASNSQGSVQQSNNYGSVQQSNNYGSVQQTQPQQEPIFGKYKDINEAYNGYKNAEQKIREQGAELNKYKEQLNDYKPMESYDSEKWSEKIQSWISDKSLPEGLTYDADIPEINMLIKGFEKAEVSEKQAKAILAGATERQIALIEERQAAVKNELGEAGMKKVSELQSFANKLTPEDQAQFSALFTFPYVEAAQVDLMHRLLLGDGREKSIPTGSTNAPMKSSQDVMNDIDNFRKTHSSRISHTPSLQEQENRMWEEYDRLKRQGF